MEIRGKIAIVTGASSGIGRAVAIDLARRGAQVAICARRPPQLEETLAECAQFEPASRAYVCDVRDREAVRLTAATVLRDFGRIDILVNNAGASVYHLFEEAPDDEIDEMMRANFLSAVFFTKEVLPPMLERRSGSIVFVSSFAGRMATWRHTAYAASKFAMTGFAEALYMEVKPRGVHVGVVYPGVIETELFDKGAGFEHLRHVIEPKRVGTEIVTRAIARLIERERFEIFAPAHLGLAWKLRAVLPETVMRGARRFVEKNFLRQG